MQSFKSRVLFREACAAIPADAVLLEVGPHAIMRAPLRQVRSGPTARWDGLLHGARMPRTHAGIFVCGQRSFESKHCCFPLLPTSVSACGTCSQTKELRSGGGWAAPTPAGVPGAQNCAAVPYVNMMKKEEDAAVSVREAVAGLWRKGAALAWDVPAGPTAGARPAAAPERAPRVPGRAQAAETARCPPQAALQPRRTRQTPAPRLQTPGLTLTLSPARAELPRDVREALVSWNHAQEYDCPTYEDYAARLGGGQFEKVYDLGAALWRPGRAA